MKAKEENMIINKAPWLIEFFADKNDAYKLSCHSNSKTWFVCPKCGKKIFSSVAHIYDRKGFHLNKCTKRIPEDTIGYKAPWMLKYLVDKSNGSAFYTSNKYADFKCPDCGNLKHSKIQNVYNAGRYYCPICSDSISYPNKFLRSIMSQLNVNCKYEYKAEWTCNRKYDCYFEMNNNKYLIEMDGIQHFENRFRDLDYEVKNDRLKDELAENNGYNLIRIDCRKSEIEYIRNNIENSLLSKLFDLSVIDWNKCNKFSFNSNKVEVCEYFMKNPNQSIDDIADRFSLSHNCVLNYLKSGTKVGLCNYSAEKAKIEKNKKSLASNIKNGNTFQFDVYKDNSFIAHFVSASEAARYLNEHFEQKSPIGSATIRGAIKLGYKSVRGYELKNITYKGDTL